MGWRARGEFPAKEWTPFGNGETDGAQPEIGKKRR